MAVFGSCKTGCSESKLELVRAAAHDSLVSAQAHARAYADAFAEIADLPASVEPPGGEHESAYLSVQAAARAALRLHPDADRPDVRDPAEPATVWWCERCGGIDAPQPCLGICVWRPVEWVNRTVYENQRERALSELERERHLRRLVRQVAFVTPRSGGWEASWDALRAAAVRLSY
jgi:hypothetical protein